MRRCLIAALFLLTGSLAGAQDLRKSVTWENLRNHPAPLPVVGEIIPRPSNLNEPSLWSVGAETMDRDYADFSKFRQYMKDTGVGYARLQSGWAKTEKKKGKYDFAWLDEHVNGLLEEGIHPWMCLCYGNPIYAERGDNPADLNRSKLFADGPVMDGWLRYVRTIVARYKGKVTLWEVWNEPDGPANKDAHDAYAHLFVRTAKAIREVDPEAKIAGFAACNPVKPFIRLGLKEIQRLGGLEYMDYLTYHSYYPIPEGAQRYIEELRKDVAAFSPHIKLLQGETGCPAQLEYGHAMHSYEWTEYSQVKWDLRQALSHFGYGIPYSFFTMVDLNYGWMLQSYGLIRCNLQRTPVYKRPKYYGVQHVTSVFTPDLKADPAVHVECDAQHKLTCFGVRNKNRAVGCLLWFSGNRPTSSLDRQLVNVRISGLRLSDPVYVDMVTGYVHEVAGLKDRLVGKGDGNIGFSDLPLWDGPILLIERKALDYKPL
ncbi:MAG: beta-galactosidase [Bacteroidales bacterium]|nr:beta-galactosidase [Bacteroidales bacterium]